MVFRCITPCIAFASRKNRSWNRCLQEEDHLYTGRQMIPGPEMISSLEVRNGVESRLWKVDYLLLSLLLLLLLLFNYPEPGFPCQEVRNGVESRLWIVDSFFPQLSGIGNDSHAKSKEWRVISTSDSGLNFISLN